MAAAVSIKSSSSSPLKIKDNLKLADTLVKHVKLVAASQAGAMRKVAMEAEARWRRMRGRIWEGFWKDLGSLGGEGGLNVN
ncbi:hypothetical protein L484_005121 [Morus notabilis]|uniref:Uncharacterized protein n=1 Tax=Morus notabilis TaxID=981085 RepID=W9QYH7_9ROSA|nr:hypothetical protein L484_005121 [Morus notabilis]